MAQKPEQKRSQLFFSYCHGVVSTRWVSLAKKLFEHSFNVYDYRDRPESDPDLPIALRERIGASDVFICLLSEAYHDNQTTWQEFQDAIEFATGGRLGSLSGQNRRPLIHVVTCDEWAVNWLGTHHPRFVYQTLQQYDLRLLPPDAVVPERANLWEDWIARMKHRLPTLIAVDTGGTAPATAASQSPQAVVAGRPTAGFAADIAAAVAELVNRLQATLPYTLLADGWHDRRDPATATAVRSVAAATSSLLVQACDAALYGGNRVEGYPSGIDLRLKLQQSGLSRDESDAALTRTLFWVPRTAADAAPVVGNAQPLRELDTGPTGPWFTLDSVAELLTWLHQRLGNPALILKAEDGISDVSPILRKGFTPYFDPLLFETVKANAIPGAIRQAAAEKAPILIAINDRGINGLAASPRLELHRRAEQFDREIEREMAGSAGTRVARAIFLVRHPDKFNDVLAITPDQEWVLLPVDPSGTCMIDAERLQKIRAALQPRG
ncbi:MAG TPA: hypothetical protein VMB34_18820 [Acetobacteraceae bacterium]|nr:hypothetical protein [Acetobacteraceae bacterium]